MVRTQSEGLRGGITIVELGIVLYRLKVPTDDIEINIMIIQHKSSQLQVNWYPTGILLYYPNMLSSAMEGKTECVQYSFNYVT